MKKALAFMLDANAQAPVITDTPPVYPGKGGTKHTCVFSGDVKEWTGSVRSLMSTGSEPDITFSGNKVVNAGVLSLLALATLATRRKRA